MVKYTDVNTNETFTTIMEGVIYPIIVIGVFACQLAPHTQFHPIQCK